MGKQTWRALIGAVIAGAFAGISAPAQATVYPIHFDPAFDGSVFIDVNPLTCPTVVGFELCTIDLVSADVVPNSGPFASLHFTAGATPGVGDAVLFSGGVITQFESVNPNIVVSEVCGIECINTAQLQFFINIEGSGPFPGTSTLTLPDNSSLTDSYVVGAAVPEPGTLGLLLGALGAGWLAKRRKLAA